MNLLRRVLLLAGGGLAGLGVGGVGVGLVLHEPMPEAMPGPEAEALASRMVAAVDGEAWAQTGAISWTFAGRSQHLWDRERSLARVRWGKNEVLLDLGTREGQATVGGVPAEGRRARRLLDAAYGRWANDSFWLNPVVKAFDQGTRRALVDLGGGRQGLLVTYDSGGVTPGDSYLWRLDAHYRPVAWQLWVSILPIGGLETSWEGWQQLPTGAWIAPQHQGMLGLAPTLSDIRAASSLQELLQGQPDPFAAIAPPAAD